MDALNTAKVDKEYRRKIYDWVSYVRGKIVGQKRREVYNSIPVEWVNPDSDLGMEIHNYHTQITSEDVFVVEIPVRELSSMAETQEWYQRNIGGYDMTKFDRLLRDKHFEEQLRNNNEGLQQAWEQYQIMLNLCSDKTFRS